VKKIAFFSKNQCYDQIFAKTSSIFVKFFGNDILKNITSVPGIILPLYFLKSNQPLPGGRKCAITIFHNWVCKCWLACVLVVIAKLDKNLPFFWDAGILGNSSP
jgi:hypothetical protein